MASPLLPCPMLSRPANFLLCGRRWMLARPLSTLMPKHPLLPIPHHEASTLPYTPHARPSKSAPSFLARGSGRRRATHDGLAATKRKRVTVCPDAWLTCWPSAKQVAMEGSWKDRGRSTQAGGWWFSPCTPSASDSSDWWSNVHCTVSFALRALCMHRQRLRWRGSLEGLPHQLRPAGGNPFPLFPTESTRFPCSR